jgi:hypothetical protein
MSEESAYMNFSKEYLVSYIVELKHLFTEDIKSLESKIEQLEKECDLLRNRYHQCGKDHDHLNSMYRNLEKKWREK